MLSDEWLSRYGLLENFNASVTRTRTRTGTGTWTTSCSRAKKKEMPPKPLPEKSYVILKNHKYFEALTLIVRIQSQEDQQSLMMTLKLNESGYFKLY